MFIKWKKTSEGDNSQERKWSWWRKNMTQGSNKHCGGDCGSLEHWTTVAVTFCSNVVIVNF